MLKRLSASTLEFGLEFQTFVCPERHPELTRFGTELIGISQEMLANAPIFQDAIAPLKSWLYLFPDSLFCSWGDYDRNQILKDGNSHRLAYPFRSTHRILKQQCSLHMGLKKKLGVTDALRQPGLQFHGSHRGS